MARYTGPVCRLCRRAGEKLFLKGERCLTPKCAVERRQGPPGQVFARRRKLSEHALQLREKQKARRIYGVLEGQFRRHFEEAQRRPGITGENLLQVLELRLDNVIYRLGFADSRSQARQLVTHGHFVVNGHNTNVPSMETKPGDTITVVESSRRLEYFQALPKELRRKMPPGWLSIDPDQLAARVLARPSRVDIGIKLNEQAIVEFYSR